MPLQDDDEICFCFHVKLRKSAASVASKNPGSPHKSVIVSPPAPVVAGVARCSARSTTGMQSRRTLVAEDQGCHDSDYHSTQRDADAAELDAHRLRRRPTNLSEGNRGQTPPRRSHLARREHTPGNPGKPTPNTSAMLPPIDSKARKIFLSQLRVPRLKSRRAFTHVPSSHHLTLQHTEDPSWPAQ